MQKREKILAVALILAVVLWGGRSILYGIFLGPLNESRQRLEALKTASDHLDTQEQQLLVLRRRMRDWKDRSLPADPMEAQRLYQEWITDLGQLSGIQALKVTPEQLMTSGAVFKSVRLIVKGQATFDQLTTFLYQFQQTNLLHRVFALKIEAPKTPTGSFAITLTAEGLCLPDAAARQRLFPRTKLADSLPRTFETMKVASAEGFPTDPGFNLRIGSETVTVTKVNGTEWTVKRAVNGTTSALHKKNADVQLVAVRADRKDIKLEDIRKALAVNPFTKPGPAPGATIDPNDPTIQTRLMATTLVDGKEPEAKLLRANDPRSTVVRKNSPISIGDIQGTVVAIEPSFIRIDRKGEIYQLDLGKNLRSMTRVREAGDDSLGPDAFLDSDVPAASGRRGGTASFGGPGRSGRDAERLGAPDGSRGSTRKGELGSGEIEGQDGGGRPERRRSRRFDRDGASPGSP